MKAWLGLGLASLVAVLAVTGYINAQASRLQAGAQTIKERDEAIGVLSANNAVQKATIKGLCETRQRENDLAAQAAEQIDQLTEHIYTLDNQIREALRNAPKNLTFDSRLPVGAADALCLQWHEASGYSARRTGDNNAAGNVDTGTAHPAAAGPGSGPDCREWRKMTIRDAVEWNGLLLRHAGLERLDKATLRRWAEGIN